MQKYVYYISALIACMLSGSIYSVRRGINPINPLVTFKLKLRITQPRVASLKESAALQYIRSTSLAQMKSDIEQHKLPQEILEYLFPLVRAKYRKEISRALEEEKLNLNDFAFNKYSLDQLISALLNY